MGKMIIWIVTAFSINNIYAANMTFVNATYFCKTVHDKRRVEVIYYKDKEAVKKSKGVRCKVNYYKETEDPGNPKILWYSNSNYKFCHDKSSTFIEKLKVWGWNCKDKPH